MGLQHIREKYNVPARLGVMVQVKGTPYRGVIMGSDKFSLLVVQLDGKPGTTTFHPNDLEYEVTK